MNKYRLNRVQPKHIESLSQLKTIYHTELYKYTDFD